MKRKIAMIITLTAVLFVIMAVSASACRQLPYAASEAVSAGEITLGTTEVKTTGDECLVYSFTPDKDGYYSVTYYDHDCSFLYTYKEDDYECLSFYYYISTEKEENGKYISTEFVDMKKGSTYNLYVANPASYECCDEAFADELTSTVEIAYEGQLKDFDIYRKDLVFSRNTVWDESAGEYKEVYLPESVEEWDDGYHLYTWFDAEFTEGGKYCECSLCENSCGIMPLRIVGNADFSEGSNKVTLDLNGFTKEFEINCSYEADEFVSSSEYGIMSVWASRVETLMTNIRTGIKIMLGLEGIGSPRPSLGMQVIRLSIIRFFSTVFSAAECY